MSWTGCQNNPICLNFYLQKSLESFEKNSADKMWFNKNSRWKVPCPVLDRVNSSTILMQLDQCRNSVGSRLLCTSTLKENLKIKIDLEKLRAPSEAADNIHLFHTSDEFVKISNKLAAPICHHLTPIFQPSPPQKWWRHLWMALIPKLEQSSEASRQKGEKKTNPPPSIS